MKNDHLLITLASEDFEDTGVYAITLEAILDDFYPIVPKVLLPFTVTLIHTCRVTTLSFGNESLADMTIYIMHMPADQTISYATNTKIVELGIENNPCGLISYALSPSKPFLQLEEKNDHLLITLVSNNFNDFGEDG